MIWTIWIDDKVIYSSEDKEELDKLWSTPGRFRDLMKLIITPGDRFQIRGFQSDKEFKGYKHELYNDFKKITK